MPERNFWAKTVPRAEIDHRAREARRRFYRIERLFVARVAGRHPWFRRPIGVGAEAPRGNCPGLSDGSVSYTVQLHDEIGEVELTPPQSLYPTMGLCCTPSAAA